jgi:hypothetical protein
MKVESSISINLFNELERQKKHIESLQRDIGRWKRLAKGQASKPEFIREQHDERGRHIIEIHLRDIPGDLDYRAVLNHIKYELLPKHYPYYYYSCYQSKKYKGWIAKIAKDDNVDMSYIPENMNNSPKEILNQLQLDIMTQLHRFEKYVTAASNNSTVKELEITKQLINTIQQSSKAIQQIKIT